MDLSIKRFVHKRCSPNWELRPEPIPFCDLTFVMQGSAVYYSESGAHLLRAGQAVFLPEGSFRCAQTKGMECAAFNFCASKPLPLPAGILDWENDKLLLRYFADFEMAWISLDEGRDLYCQGMLLLILHRLQAISKQRTGNPHVPAIRQYLEEHYLEPVTVEEVARAVGLHPTYCGALFRRETGRTILQTVNLLRINRATAMLEYGASGMTETAMACGFSDLFYFSRVFKQITGLSPSKFAAEHRQAP